MHCDTLLDGNHIWLMQSIYCDIHEQVASTHYSYPPPQPTPLLASGKVEVTATYTSTIYG